jgi:alginate O-acetyltransferase complex protein AlgI
MVFSSIIFLLFFLPAFLVAYHLIDMRYKNLLLLGASIVFYSWGAPLFVFVILGSTFLDFYIVKALHASEEEKRRKLFLGLSLLMNLGLLAYFKYANFFVENVNAFLYKLGMSSVEWTAVALPIGISFYTFQTLTYSIDVYRRVAKPLEKVTDYMLYIMSFPQMIAGPIVRFNSIAKQITDRKDLLDDKLIGLYRFSIGLAKKVLIANVMAEQADLVFNGDMSQISTSMAWVGIIAYTFQIYFDFSGYSDMAIGLGRMMGFRFPENFNSPYTSTSITEFWRRWHITLGAFMKDYLYIPLGGNRVVKYRLYFNLWLVFLLSGLWHGASWNFVLWGAFHGFFLILDRLFLLRFLTTIGKIPATIFTFFVAIMGWTIFRIEDMDHWRLFMGQLFSFQQQNTFNVDISFLVVAGIALLFSFFTASKAGKKMEAFFYFKDNYTSQQHILLTLLSGIFLLLSIASITASDFNPFIYFRF